jgi:hypothetical protein
MGFNGLQIYGTLGVGLLLLLQNSPFFVMPLFGAGPACYTSVLIIYVPSVIPEGKWCIVSVEGSHQTTCKK